MKERYGEQGLRVISVHTPEFDFEKSRARVERAVEKHELDQPVYMDNDYAFWRAIGNRYWPSFYLVDRAGIVRLKFVGEMHAETARAKRFERLTEELLAEPPPREIGGAGATPSPAG